MSVFSNLASGASEGAEAYIAAVLDLVGDQDPMAVLGATPEWCRAAVEPLSDSVRSTPEAPGKWSIAAVVQHLADSELVWAIRLRRVLAEDGPRLVGFDQDQWADRLGYEGADWRDALAVFAAVRNANLALLRRATPEDLERVAVHEERGDEPLHHMVRLYAGHDLAHRRQIERIAARLTGAEG